MSEEPSELSGKEISSAIFDEITPREGQISELEKWAKFRMTCKGPDEVLHSDDLMEGALWLLGQLEEGLVRAQRGEKHAWTAGMAALVDHARRLCDVEGTLK